jgi:hypothetical protein
MSSLKHFVTNQEEREHIGQGHAITYYFLPARAECWPPLCNAMTLYIHTYTAADHFLLIRAYHGLQCVTIIYVHSLHKDSSI